MSYRNLQKWDAVFELLNCGPRDFPWLEKEEIAADVLRVRESTRGCSSNWGWMMERRFKWFDLVNRLVWDATRARDNMLKAKGKGLGRQERRSRRPRARRCRRSLPGRPSWGSRSCRLSRCKQNPYLLTTRRSWMKMKNGCRSYSHSHLEGSSMNKPKNGREN